MGVELKQSDRGADALTRRLTELAQSVTIGVHDDAAPYPDGTDVVVVAASHEFGTPELPRRSFLRAYADSGGKAKIGDAAAKQLGKVVDGADAKTIGEEIGDVAVAGVLDTMAKGIRGEPHPGYTGKTAGTGRNLEDTGHLRSQITAKVVDE